MITSCSLTIFIFIDFSQILQSCHLFFFKQPLLRKIAAIYFDLQYHGKIKKFLDLHQPDVVINVFWMFRPSLDILLKDSHVRYLTIVTDPWSVHPFVASTVTESNLAFDEQTAISIKSLVPDAPVNPIGWFVRDAFEKPFNKKTVRDHLKLSQDKLSLLFTTGSEGTEKIVPIVTDLITTNFPVQIIVACGNNKHLLETINDLKKNLKENITLHAIPFTNELHFYMQAADLVIGKAGPNSVFESVACHTPFFAVTHIAGQEDGNLDIIRELKLGYVEENPVKAAKLLHQIIEKPEQLKQFINSLKNLATYNEQAKEKIKKILKVEV